ncbi:nuclear protein UL4 [Spheniscid alphaherpesvirus 1]|uniref:Nuclear protein UL4 n=1 Tax=Spheniscid alphaherpesvirus 1 TaxID=2560777 RepID=A0A1R3TAL6_9ALPH|nr:nuclear protein UL4 [Spheniscid alphaherpesvirus 1]
MGAPATFITYTLRGVRSSQPWAVPDYEQIVCSCDGGTRSVTVGSLSRCDILPPGNFILQKGPAGTLLVLDCEPEFCSYLLRDCGVHYGQLSSIPWSLGVFPFSSCTVVGRDRCVDSSNACGVLTVTWLRESVYVTLTVYGSRDISRDEHLVNDGAGCDGPNAESATLCCCDGEDSISGNDAVEVSDGMNDLLAEAIREAALNTEQYDADLTALLNSISPKEFFADQTFVQ